MTAVNKTDRPFLHTQGFSFIEVLVALIVSSIGLLALVQLQTRSSLHTQETLYYNLAVTAADNMAQFITTQSNNSLAGEDLCLVANCSQNAIQQRALRQWQQQIQQLPDGTGEIQTSAQGSNRLYLIIITWSGRLKPFAKSSNCPVNKTQQHCHIKEILL